MLFIVVSISIIIYKVFYLSQQYKSAVLTVLVDYHCTSITAGNDLRLHKIGFFIWFTKILFNHGLSTQGIVYLIMLCLLTLPIYLRIDVISSGRIKTLFTILKHYHKEPGVEVEYSNKLEAIQRWSAICRVWPWILTYQKFLLCILGQDLYSHQKLDM